jgi:hypothetical protein
MHQTAVATDLEIGSYFINDVWPTWLAGVYGSGTSHRTGDGGYLGQRHNIHR